MIEFGSIKKTYNNQVVLDLTNFSIDNGKITAITGPNGSGKSTLARILAGIISSDDKTINCKMKVAYLPQKPYVFDLTLEKNILINGGDREKCEKLINSFGITYLKSKRAKGFSGGEQQKLALARLMMKDYDLVILDEPTSAMDEKSQNVAEKIILEYAKNKTLVIITHDKSQISKIADKTIFMNNGKIDNGTIKS